MNALILKGAPVSIDIKNKLSIDMTGGEKFVGKNNMLHGSKLDFVDRIKKFFIFNRRQHCSFRSRNSRKRNY